MKVYTIQDYLNKKSLIKDSEISKLSESYLQKAKTNLLTASILFDANNNQEARKILQIPQNYSSDEWVVVSAYYAMYASALALLAKIGYKSSSHSATIVALEQFFVKKELIGKEFLAILKHAQITQQEIQNLASAKDNREIAQYSVTKATSHFLAEVSKKNAYSFVEKAEKLIREN
ncbi:MAG: hypothetical protein NT076_03170 [Candidatus Pacearchaeota archaeon]|nr:hypothetical protein [Candidatus Pacearchaeota archaeon]